MSWTDDVPDPERDLDELRDVVARKAGRLRNRRRLGIVSGAAAVVAVLVVLASLPSGGGKPRRLQAADRPETSTTVEGSTDDTFDLSNVHGEEPTTTVAGQTSSTTAKRKAGATKPTTVSSQSDCRAPVPGSGVQEDRAPGVWLRCQGGSPFGDTPEVGLEIASDGRWAKLFDGGGYVRARDWGDNGWWSVNQGVGYLSMQGTNETRQFQVGADGLTMQISGSIYRRGPAGTAIGTAPHRPGDDCTRGEGQQRVYSLQEARAAIARVWLTCSGRSFSGNSADGLEIRSDGTWVELDRNQAGELVRSNDRARSGTYSSNDPSPSQDGSAYGFIFSSRAEANFLTAVFFATESPKMRVQDGQAPRFDYIPAPSGTQVVDG